MVTVVAERLRAPNSNSGVSDQQNVGSVLLKRCKLWKMSVRDMTFSLTFLVDLKLAKSKS